MKPFLILILFFIASCAKTNNNGSVANLENHAMAAVISGCTYTYEGHFIVPIDTKRSCTTTWENINGNKININGPTNLVFVEPGTYEFVGYHSDTSPRSSYTKYPNTLSIFNKFSIKSGEVIYIGHFNVDSRKTKFALQSMFFSQKETLVEDYLNKFYPTLINRMKSLPITFSQEAENVRKIFLKNK